MDMPPAKSCAPSHALLSAHCSVSSAFKRVESGTFAMKISEENKMVRLLRAHQFAARAWKDRAMRLEAHLERLEAHCKKLENALPQSRQPGSNVVVVMPGHKPARKRN